MEPTAEVRRSEEMKKKTLLVGALLLLGTVLAGVALASAPGAVPPAASAAPSPGSGAVPISADRQAVPAPIESAQVISTRSIPPQFVLGIVAGLPGGCAKAHDHKVTRSGELITVAVTNTMPIAPTPCTMIYGTYRLNIALGSDFRPGVTYTVRVNERTVTFTGL
ncbi:MAG: hypothetical protein FJ034_06585 [Chloroflexi bacterium]|nr:hypothetical protein [Chloroflexota bacterium]